MAVFLLYQIQCRDNIEVIRDVEEIYKIRFT